MKCPVCSGRSLAVEVSFRGMVPCQFGSGGQVELMDGTEFDSEWDDSSRSECLICGWRGTLRETRSRSTPRTGPSEPVPAPASGCAGGSAGAVDLDEIRELLDQAPCPRLWRPRVEALVREVERLRAVMDAMARISAPRRRRRGASDEDTVVG